MRAGHIGSRRPRTCNRSASLRPDVVRFGAKPPHPDAVVAVGTSGSVHTAATCVTQARALGIRACGIKLASSDTAGPFDEAHDGQATRAVPDFLDFETGWTVRPRMADRETFPNRYFAARQDMDRIAAPELQR